MEWSFPDILRWLLENPLTAKSDPTMENKLIPYQTSPLPDACRVLVFAPHPDDEIFGPGGTLALYAAQGTPVKVIVLTDGAVDRVGEEKIRWQQLRQAESVAAAKVLGIAPPIFWDFPDRGLACGEGLIERMLVAIREHQADLVLTTASTEMHPDHRALALAGVEAVRRLAGSVRLLMYEIGVAIPSPSLLIDITPVLSRKTEAMACFPSQLAIQRYDEHIKALNCFRTYTLGAEVTAAEAFLFWNPAVDGLIWQESAQERQAEAQEKRCKELGEQLISQQQELQRALEQLAAIRASTSWRMTAWLRYLIQRLRLL